MKKADRVKLVIGISCMLLISVVAAYTMHWLFMIMWIVPMLFVVHKVSCCKWYESMWVFVLTALGSIPINISLTCRVMATGLLDSGFAFIGDFFMWAQTYLLLLSYEEIIIGLLARCIWKKQKTMEEVL